MPAHTQFDFHYAVRNTEILLAPKRHIETFGNTIVNYAHVAELMDSVGQVRIREGRLQAMRPQIIMPSAYANLSLEGFGQEAEKYLSWLKEHEDDIRILQYGYALKQEAYSEEVVTDSLDNVLARVKKSTEEKNDPPFLGHHAFVRRGQRPRTERTPHVRNGGRNTARSARGNRKGVCRRRA